MNPHGAVASLRFAMPVFAAAGLVLGMAYFVSLRRIVQSLAARRAWLPYVSSAIARIAVTALFLTFAARWGVPVLLAAFAGFLSARQLAVRSARRLA